MLHSVHDWTANEPSCCKSKQKLSFMVSSATVRKMVCKLNPQESENKGREFGQIAERQVRDPVALEQ